MPRKHRSLLLRLPAAALASVICVGGCYPVAGSGKKRGVPAEPRPVTYLALGDSTCDGIGAKRGGYANRLFTRIERTHPHARFLNLCASGAATADVLREQVAPATLARPTLMTLGVGANDLIRGVTEDQFTLAYAEIVARLKAVKGARLLVMNIPDLSLAPAVPDYMRAAARRHVLAYNERIRGIAEKYGVPVIDLYDNSGGFISHPDFFSPDGLHPSDSGYDFWAALVWPAARAALVQSVKPHARFRPRLLPRGPRFRQ